VRYCGGVAPGERENGPLTASAEKTFATLTASMEKLDYSGGFGAVWDLIRDTNAYIEDRQPWALERASVSEPGIPARGERTVEEVLGDCLEALRIVALLASPLVPRASAELWRRLGLSGTPAEQRLPEAAVWGGLAAGSTLEKGEPLFPRIET